MFTVPSPLFSFIFLPFRRPPGSLCEYTFGWMGFLGMVEMLLKNDLLDKEALGNVP